MSRKNWMIVVLAAVPASFLLCCCLCGIGGNFLPPSERQGDERQPVAAKTTSGGQPVTGKPKSGEEMQAKRKAILDELIQRGGATKLETKAYPPRLWVTPIFMSNTFDTKQSILSAINAYVHDIPQGTVARRGEVLELVDSINGKRVGELGRTGLIID